MERRCSLSEPRALSQLLLSELAASNGRLAAWLENPDFTAPPQRSVPDPTFKTWPLRYMAPIISLFLARLRWNSQAVRVLCEQDLAVQAQPVLRAALESTIDLRYISTNPQTLVSKWCLFEEVNRYRHWKTRPDDLRPDNFGLSEKQIDLRLRQLNRHRPLSGGKVWTLTMLSRDWDQSNLAERDRAACSVLGADEAELYWMYKLLCFNTHGGAESASDFVVALGDGHFQVATGVAGRKQVFVPWLANVCLKVSIDSARRCGASLDSGIGPQVDSLGIDPDELVDAATEDFARPGSAQASI